MSEIKDGGCICRDTTCCSLCGVRSCDCGPNCGLTWNMTHRCPVHKASPNDPSDYGRSISIPAAMIQESEGKEKDEHV